MSLREAILSVKRSIEQRSSELSLVNTTLREDELGELVHYIQKTDGLKFLFLKNCRLPNYDFLMELRSLTHLDLSKNGLKEIDFLITLDNLKSLDLSSNFLQTVDLSALTNLRTLDLSENKLTTITLPRLSSLVELSLSKNNLTEIEFPKFRNLNKLDISHNSLKEIIFPKLENLMTLDVSHNSLTNGSFLRQLPRLTALNITSNPLDLPENLFQLTRSPFYTRFISREFIRPLVNYYKQLNEQGEDCVYEARVLIVGEPGAGKTTLFRKLKDNKYTPIELTEAERKSTVGVDIDAGWKFKFVKDRSKEFVAHLWDFGGQKIQYALHQYFLTEKSLYILLSDDRKQLNNFHYWFEIISTLGVGCPVLVVLNEINHESITSFSLKEFRDEFKNKIKTIDKLDVDFSKEDGRFQVIQRDIQTKLSNLEHVGRQLPAQWKIIRSELEKLGKDTAYISIDEYFRICSLNTIVEEEDARNLLDYLHYLGIALNYKGDDHLESIVILSPGWIIDALYSVLKNKHIKENLGRFDKEFVFNLWKKDGYEDRDDYKLLLSLMLKGKFEIAYRLKKINQYIVPLLLPETTPLYTFNDKNLIQIYLKYRFMPAGLLSRLIVRLNENIVEQKGRQIVWERGVLLNHKTSVAEVTENQNKKQILIRVSGENFIYNRETITIIRNELERIHADWFDNRLEVEEFVPCICSVCSKRNEKQFYSVHELEDYLRSNDFEIKCAKSRSERRPKNVVVRALLEGVYIEGARHTYKETTTVFNIGHIGQLINRPDQFDSKIKMIVNTLDDEFNKILSMQEESRGHKEQLLIDEIQIMLNEVMSVIGHGIEQLETSEQRRYENLKENNEWESSLTLVIPLLDKIGIKIETKTKLESILNRCKGILKNSLGSSEHPNGVF